MAGNHRAPRPATPSRLGSRALAFTVIVALVPAVYLGAHKIFSSGSPTPTPGASRSSDLPIPAVSPSTTAPPPTPTPTPTPTPVVVPTSKPLTKVRTDAPRRLNIPGVLDVGFNNSTQPRAGLFTAASTGEIARWGTRGSPGSPGTDTVFLVGKIDGSRSAFGALGTVRPGMKITIRTNSGHLTYTVSAVARHQAAGLTSDPTFAARTPGRLILIGLEYSGGTRTRTVLLVTAQLSGATTT